MGISRHLIKVRQKRAYSHWLDINKLGSNYSVSDVTTFCDGCHIATCEYPTVFVTLITLILLLYIWDKISFWQLAVYCLSVHRADIEATFDPECV